MVEFNLPFTNICSWDKSTIPNKTVASLIYDSFTRILIYCSLYHPKFIQIKRETQISLSCPYLQLEPYYTLASIL